MTDPKPPVVVFCERLDNESFCASVVRELGAYYEVRPCGPGWELETLAAAGAEGARFVLELDAASGAFVRPQPRRAESCVPRFAWLIDTHKKPDFHRRISAECDLTFYAMQPWGHALLGERVWLPVHFDPERFYPREVERDLDLVFVGSQTWRAEPLRRIAARHRLRLHVGTTTGPREKSETAALYARSKLVFNRHVTNDLNFRVVEAMGCGRALLTDAQHNGQYELFEDGRHYLLYKDEPDLERLVLCTLEDEAARSRIERAAAERAHAEHSTPARVAQLRQAIEAYLGREQPPREAEPRPTILVTAAAAPRAETHAERAPGADTRTPRLPVSSRRRWLVLAGPEPATASLLSYAELLARDLAERGDVVTLVRARRGVLAGAPCPDRSPGWVEVELGPLPAPASEASRLLVEAAALQRRAEDVARRHGPFDALLVEGALGALLGPDLAARLEVPLHLALEGCEVARRRNRLTREQLYLAELEHWGAERAREVWTASQAAAAAVRDHYGVDAAPVRPRVALAPPAGADRLLTALGLGAPPALVVLAPPADRAGPPVSPGRDVLFVGDGLWRWRPDGSLDPLTTQPVAGPGLAALLGAAGQVLTLDEADLRAWEAEALGTEVRGWRGPEPPDLGELAGLLEQEVSCATA